MRAPYLSSAPDDGESASRHRGLGKSGGLAVGLVWDVGAWDKRGRIPAELSAISCGRRHNTLLAPAQHRAPIGSRRRRARDISTSDIVRVLGHLLQSARPRSFASTRWLRTSPGALGCEAWVLLHADCDWRWPVFEIALRSGIRACGFSIRKIWANGTASSKRCGRRWLARAEPETHGRMKGSRELDDPQVELVCGLRCSCRRIVVRRGFADRRDRNLQDGQGPASP